MNWNFQLGIHPDADQLSVFVEGAATSTEHERMLAHLAECAECRKAVFFMQPHYETQRSCEDSGKRMDMGAALAGRAARRGAGVWTGCGAGPYLEP